MSDIPAWRLKDCVGSYYVAIEEIRKRNTRPDGTLDMEAVERLPCFRRDKGD